MADNSNADLKRKRAKGFYVGNKKKVSHFVLITLNYPFMMLCTETNFFS